MPTINKRVIHGHRKGGRTPEYNAWDKMKQRCYNPKAHNYKDYGGRGIRVCDRWIHSFENFLSDMGRRPSSNHSIDRFPDNNGNYEPSNCRWATRVEQNNNQRKRFSRVDEWCKKTGLKAHTYFRRKKLGLPLDAPKLKTNSPKERILVLEKKCSKCGETKPSCMFHKEIKNIDNLKSWCKPCVNKQRNERRRIKLYGA